MWAVKESNPSKWSNCAIDKMEIKLQIDITLRTDFQSAYHSIILPIVWIAKFNKN